MLSRTRNRFLTVLNSLTLALSIPIRSAVTNEVKPFLSVGTLKLILLGGFLIANGIILVQVLTSGSFADCTYWLILPVMMLHQVEEHILTECVFGQRLSFLVWAKEQGFDLTPTRAAALNCLVGWTLGTLAGLCGGNWLLVPLFVLTVEGVNGCWHIMTAVRQRRWSPGVVSSLLVTIPFATWLMGRSMSLELVSVPIVASLVTAAFVSHHCFISSLRKQKNPSRRESGRDLSNCLSS